MTRAWITMERTFDATLEEVWALWTTKDGLESWWGPDGFRVEVHTLDLRPGGSLRYSMIADSPAAIDAMKRQGMPTRHEARITFRAIVPRQRLAYTHAADFIPGVAAYDVETEVVLEQQASTVKMTLRFDRMHDETWTQRAAAGWEMELDRLARRLHR